VKPVAEKSDGYALRSWRVKRSSDHHSVATEDPALGYEVMCRSIA
jgi:hypothetical protein